MKEENYSDLYTFVEHLKKEMIANGIYYKKAKFIYYNSGSFTFEYSNHTKNFSFNITCHDTILFKMTIKQLFELLSISWFEYIVRDIKTHDVLSAHTYTSLT